MALGPSWARRIMARFCISLEPQYHGNPVSEDGALVTVDWGYNVCERIFDVCGLFTHMIYIDDLSKGIRAQLNEVLVTYKPC